MAGNTYEKPGWPFYLLGLARDDLPVFIHYPFKLLTAFRTGEYLSFQVKSIASGGRTPR